MTAIYSLVARLARVLRTAKEEKGVKKKKEEKRHDERQYQSQFADPKPVHLTVLARSCQIDRKLGRLPIM